MTVEIQVLSAGAVKTGIGEAAEVFGHGRHGRVLARFATAPTIRAQAGGGSLAADVLIVPPGAMNEIAALGRVEDERRIALGRVGAGVAIRDGAPVPEIGTVEALQRSLAAADTIAFNKASTGIYIETLLERLGLSDALADRIARQDNGAAVMRHLLEHTGRDIGFGAITEILVFKDRGVRLVGALPEAIQNYTRYEAAPVRGAVNRDGARAFVAFLASPRGKEILRRAGIEP
jgi:molybdate transport system substrate-binding protein